MDFDRGIELIVGPMFCGKTEELMRRLRRAEIAKRKIQVFKPDIDDRYDEKELSTHSGLRMSGIAVKNMDELIKSLENETKIVGVDEIQFFDDKIIDFSIENRTKYLFILTGLSLDFRGEPFRFRDSKRHIGELMPYCRITSISAICNECGSEKADFSQRFIDGKLAPYYSPLILVGERETYEARCVNCFIIPTKTQ